MDKVQQKKLSGGMSLDRLSSLKGKFKKFLSDGRTKAESEKIYTTLDSEERGNGGSSSGRLLEEILRSRSSSSSSSSDSEDDNGSEFSAETKTEKNNSDSSPFLSEKRKNGPGSTGSSHSSNEKSSRKKATTGELKETALLGEGEGGTERKDDRKKRPLSKRQLRKQFSWFLEEQRRKRGEQGEVEAEGEESSPSSPPESSGARSDVVDSPLKYLSHPASPANLAHNVNLNFRRGESSPVSLVHSISANQPEILRDLNQVSEISVESPVSSSSLDYELQRPPRYKSNPTSPANLTHNVNLHFRRGESSPVSLVHSISASQPEVLRDLSQVSEISVESPASSGSLEYDRQGLRKNYPHPARLADNLNLNYRGGDSSPVSLVHSISVGESDELRDLGQVMESSVASPTSSGSLDRKSLSSIQRSQSTPAAYDRTNHPHHHEGGVWRCKKCGWAYTSPYPSAQLREEHRRHCEEITKSGQDVVDMQAEENDQEGGGSRDESPENTGSQENLTFADLRPRARLSRAESDQVGDEDIDSPERSNSVTQEDAGTLGVSEPVEEAESEGEESSGSTSEGKTRGIRGVPISPGSSTTLSSDAVRGEDSSPDASSSDDEHAEVSSEKNNARESVQDSDEGGGDALQEGSRELESRRSDTTSQSGENTGEREGQDPQDGEEQESPPDREEQEFPPDKEVPVTPALESEVGSVAPGEAEPDGKPPQEEPETPPDPHPVDDTDSSMKDKKQKSKSKARKDEAPRADDAPGEAEAEANNQSSDDLQEPKSDIRSESKPEPESEPESKPEPKLEKAPSVTPDEEEEEANHLNGDGTAQNDKNEDGDGKKEPIVVTPVAIVSRGDLPTEVQAVDGDRLSSIQRHWEDIVKKDPAIIRPSTNTSEIEPDDEPPPRELHQGEITRHPEPHGGPHELSRDPHGRHPPEGFGDSHGHPQEASTSARGDRVYDFPTIVREQNTHDMICPVCYSNVTKRIILRKRKRWIHDEREAVPDKRPVIEQEEPTPVDDTPQPDEPYEVWGCCECFNYFIRLFRREPKPPVIEKVPAEADTGWLPRLCPPFDWGPPIEHPDVVEPLLQDTAPGPTDDVQEPPRVVLGSKPREVVEVAGSDGVQPPLEDSSEAPAPPFRLWRQGSSWGDKAPNYQVPPELYESSQNQYHKQPWKPKPPAKILVEDPSKPDEPPFVLWRQGSSWGDKAPNYQVPPELYESSQNQYQKQPWKPKPPAKILVEDTSKPGEPPYVLWRQGSSWGDKAPNYQVPPEVYESLQKRKPKPPAPRVPSKGKEPVVEEVVEHPPSADPTVSSDGQPVSSDRQPALAPSVIHGVEKEYYYCCIPIKVFKKEYWAPQVPGQGLEESLLPGEKIREIVVEVSPDQGGQLEAGFQPEIKIVSQPPTRAPTEEKPYEYLKPIVHGGLDVSLVSIGLVSSGVGGDAKTLTIVAIGLANLFFGVIKYFSFITSLYAETPRQFEEKVGNRYRLNGFIAILSYVFFGALAPITYGFSFRHTKHLEFKYILTCVVALISIIFLGVAKATVQGKPAVKLTSTLVVTVLAAAASAYEAGYYVREILVALGFDSV